MAILVTGGAGYIGSHMRAIGYRLAVIDAFTTFAARLRRYLYYRTIRV